MLRTAMGSAAYGSPEQLDQSHREAVEDARRRPPPETVKAYQEVFGRLPQGWPPEV
jgi:hypothetical protein